MRIFILFIIVLFGCNEANYKEKSMFKVGKTKIVYSFKVGNEGGIYIIDGTNSELDGTIIQIPPKALNRKITISVGYNDGSIKIKSGKRSNIILVLEASNNLKKFLKPIKIILKIDKDINPLAVIGYKIDKNGRLHAIDTIYDQKNGGEIQFLTYVPLMMTWVYIF